MCKENLNVLDIYIDMLHLVFVLALPLGGRHGIGLGMYRF